MSGRVRIGTCANPADAAFVRSMFTARGIEVVIAAEHHASLLGAIGSSFLSLDIWVAEADAEEAAALLRDLRGESAGTAPAAADGPDPDATATGDGEAEANAAANDDANGAANDEDDDGDLEARIRQRRRTGLALLLGCCVTFGTAHMVTGAWLRGIAFAALEIAGIRLLIHGDRLGSLLVVVAIITDLIGAIWRLHTEPRAALPVARIRRS